jgi:HSP20 family protein
MLSSLFTSDVRQTLDQFRRSVDQMFENFYGYQTQPIAAPASGERAWSFSPVVESSWTDSHLNLRAILPGVSEKDVRVTVQNNQLILEGERQIPEGFDKNSYTQLAYGKFYASWNLPSGVDLEHVNCRLANGVLEIQIPILEANKPRQIRIHGASEQKAITG